MALVRLLRSPRLALAVIATVGTWSAVGAWLPWSLPGGAPPPPWARTLGLDHPFATPFFLAAVGLLFASTLACTWGKRARIRRVRSGELPPHALRLAPRPGADPGAFLAARGFRPRGGVLVRDGAGLWGGWVFHVGLLLLIAGVLVQQSLFDTGFFELTEGETARLDAPGVLVSRERGPLASDAPPGLAVTLLRFDPYASQEGYAPDRLSELAVERAGGSPERVRVDRAAGVRAAGVELFHAIPTGLAVNLEIPGLGRRSVHLRGESDRLAVADLSDPAGRPARLELASERPLDDPMGTGAIRVELVQDGARIPLRAGARFRFGDRDATVLSVARWGRYSYAVAPGMSLVLGGFAVVLAGCALLLLPAGVARAGDAGEGAEVFLLRGGAALAAEWERHPADARAPGGSDLR